jgi:hypothetical protein
VNRSLDYQIDRLCLGRVMAVKHAARHGQPKRLNPAGLLETQVFTQIQIGWDVL